MNRRLFHYCSNKKGLEGTQIARMLLKRQGREMVDYSPEKAGVGGSIPSLATRF